MPTTNNQLLTHLNQQTRVSKSGHSGHVIKTCRKTAREARNRDNRVPNKIVDPCETCGKKSHKTQECYSGANWAIRPQWWKSPKATSPNNIPIPSQPQGQYIKDNTQWSKHSIITKQPAKWATNPQSK